MKAPARFLCICEKDSFSEIVEVTHTEANPLQYFGFIIAAFNEAICPGDIQRVQDLLEPVMICFCAAKELRNVH